MNQGNYFHLYQLPLVHNGVLLGIHYKGLLRWDKDVHPVRNILDTIQGTIHYDTHHPTFSFGWDDKRMALDIHNYLFPQGKVPFAQGVYKHQDNVVHILPQYNDYGLLVHIQ